MSNYTTRYERLLGKVIEKHNRWCDSLAGKRVSDMPLDDLQLMMDINPDYISNLKCGEIDPEQLKVLPLEMAMLHDKRKAEKSQNQSVSE